MTVVYIDDPDDPRISDYRDLSDPELVRSRGRFIAEGRLVVQRVIEDGGHFVHSVLVNETGARALEQALAALPATAPVYVCRTPDFLRITGYNIHRGCLALVERPAPIATCEILRRSRTLVVLEAVANADNVGGVFRNVAAFGADAVILSPTCCDPLYRKAIRTSMAATLRVPFARADEWPGVLEDVRATGFMLAALTPRRPSQTLDEFADAMRRDRVALLLGAEGEGLSMEAESIADVRVRIPITDAVDSLNVAVACGIALSRLA